MKDERTEKKVIGIVCAGIHEEGVQSTVLELIDEIKKRGHKAIVICTYTYFNTEYTTAEISVFKLINSELFDGFVLLPETIKTAEVWDSVLGDVKRSGRPFICVDRDVEGCSCITYDYGSAFEQVVRHMIEVHKPKRINFIGGIENNSFSEERHEVFKKVMADNGLEFDPRRFGYGNFWDYPTLEVMESFYNSDLEFPDAIICCNDAEAITACKFLHQHNLSIPGDVIVSGFDGIEQEKYMVPRLTTAACDFEQMCRTALDQLEIGMDGGEMERLTVMPYTIRVSQSCGCAPISEEENVNKLLGFYDRIYTSEYHEKTMFDYSRHMIELKDYWQLTELMPRFTGDKLWCCINPSFLDSTEERNKLWDCYDEEMVMFVQIEGELKDKNVMFKATDLLPDMNRALSENDALMIVPMGFQSETIGYMTVVLDRPDFNFLYTQRFVNNTNQILETLKTRINLQNAYAKVADMHMRDPMTGIYNRRGFYMRMSDLAENGVQDFGLFSADLDKLKEINDTYGHSAGDRAIIATAEVVQRAAGDDAICARFGGDEFIVVIPFKDKEWEPQSYIDKVNAEVAAFNAAGDEPFKLGVSIGDAFLQITDRENIDTAMKAADQKMYECKRKHHADKK